MVNEEVEASDGQDDKGNNESLVVGDEGKGDSS